MERFDFDGRKAYVRAVDCDYYTDAITYTKVTILDTFATEGARRGDGCRRRRRCRAASHGEVHVVSRVVGFKKIKFYTNENVGSGELDLPEQQMHTSSYWLTIPAGVMQALPFGGDDKRDGVVGLAFAMKNIAQLLLMCDGHDIGISVDGGCDRASGADRRVGGRRRRTIAAEPHIFIYDNYPGGIGFSRPLYDMHLPLLERTRELIDGCPVRVGLSVVCRAGRQYRPARQAGGVAHSSHLLGAAARPQTEDGSDHPASLDRAAPVAAAAAGGRRRRAASSPTSRTTAIATRRTLDLDRVADRARRPRASRTASDAAWRSIAATKPTAGMATSRSASASSTDLDVAQLLDPRWPWRRSLPFERRRGLHRSRNDRA